MYSEYRLLAMQTICTGRTFRHLILTVRNSAAVLGSFSIDDGNGSGNVGFQMNSRFFNLCRVFSNLLKMASVGEFPWS